MACRSESEIPIRAGKARLEVDHMHVVLRADQKCGRRPRREPSGGGSPLDRTAPFERLNDAHRIIADSLGLETGLEDLPGCASLESFVEVEIIGVILESAGRDRHPAMDVVRRDPERVVMGMVGRRFRGHWIAGGCEQWIYVRTAAALSQRQDRPSILP